MSAFPQVFLGCPEKHLRSDGAEWDMEAHMEMLLKKGPNAREIFRQFFACCPLSSAMHFKSEFFNVLLVSDFKSNHFFRNSSIVRLSPDKTFPEYVSASHAFLFGILSTFSQNISL